MSKLGLMWIDSKLRRKIFRFTRPELFLSHIEVYWHIGLKKWAAEAYLDKTSGKAVWSETVFADRRRDLPGKLRMKIAEELNLAVRGVNERMRKRHE